MGIQRNSLQKRDVLSRKQLCRSCCRSVKCRTTRRLNHEISSRANEQYSKGKNNLELSESAEEKLADMKQCLINACGHSSSQFQQVKLIMKTAYDRLVQMETWFQCFSDVESLEKFLSGQQQQVLDSSLDTSSDSPHEVETESIIDGRTFIVDHSLRTGEISNSNESDRISGLGGDTTVHSTTRKPRTCFDNVNNKPRRARSSRISVDRSTETLETSQEPQTKLPDSLDSALSARIAQNSTTNDSVPDLMARSMDQSIEIPMAPPEILLTEATFVDANVSVLPNDSTLPSSDLTQLWIETHSTQPRERSPPETNAGSLYYAALEETVLEAGESTILKSQQTSVLSASPNAPLLPNLLHRCVQGEATQITPENTKTRRRLAMISAATASISSRSDAQTTTENPTRKKPVSSPMVRCRTETLQKQPQRFNVAISSPETRAISNNEQEDDGCRGSKRNQENRNQSRKSAVLVERSRSISNSAHRVITEDLKANEISDISASLRDLGQNSDSLNTDRTERARKSTRKAAQNLISYAEPSLKKKIRRD